VNLPIAGHRNDEVRSLMLRDSHVCRQTTIVEDAGSL